MPEARTNFMGVVTARFWFTIVHGGCWANPALSPTRACFATI
jgi:hypothetical protein